MPTHRTLIAPNRQTVVLTLLLIVTLIGGLLRFGRLGDKSLWIDEAFSVWMAGRTVPEMLSWLVRIDQHPPLYYLLLHWWMCTGDGLGQMNTPEASAAWVRALSALAGTLNIPVLYALGQRLAGRRVGLLAAFVLALSPFHLSLAQEARMYALLCLNASLALLGLIHLLAAPPMRDQNGAPSLTADRGRRRRRRSSCGGKASSFLRSDGGGSDCLRSAVQGPAWAAYILFTAATLWTHNTAILFLVAANLSVLSLALARRAQAYPAHSSESLAPPPLRNWALAQVGVLLLWLPWVDPFIRQAMGVYREFWLPVPTWRTVLEAIHNMMSAFLPPTVAATAVLWSLYVAAATLSIYRLRARPARLALLAACFATPIAGELLVSLHRPIFYARTLIWASIPLYLLFAIGLGSGQKTRVPGRNQVSFRRYVPAAFGLLILVALNASSLHNYYSNYQKEQWDHGAAYVAQRVQDEDLILYHASWTQLPFDFYFGDVPTVTKRGMPVDLFDRGLLEPKMTADDLSYLYEVIEDHDRIWLVYSHNWYTDPQNLIPAALAHKARLVSRQQFHGLEIYLYESPLPPVETRLPPAPSET